MDDLIRRQDAIKAICEDGTALERQGRYSLTMAERKQRDADILEALPSTKSVDKDINVPANDSISRQDALEALRQCHKHCIDPFDSYHIDIEDAEARIRRVPSAQQDGQWIPVTPKTMPKAGEIVWVTLPEYVGENGEKYYSGVISAYYIDLGDGWWFRSDGVKCGELGSCGATPIAWMPKPKPWKGVMRHEGDD